MQAIIFIPTYNERDNIVNLINQIFDLNPDIGILVVDDNSPDGTGRIVDEIKKREPRISIIHRHDSPGRGLAGIAGMKYAINQRADCIVEMDADFSHDPKYIPLLLEEIKDYDVVIGSRRVHGGKIIGVSTGRRFLSFLAQLFCRFILGIGILDATSGFRCFKKHVLESIDLDKLKSKGPSIIGEINLHIQKRGFKIKEIPIVFKARSGGLSKLNLMKTLDALCTLLQVRFAR